MKKRILTMLLSSSMILPLAACGSGSSSDSSATQAETAAEETTEAAAETSAEASTEAAAETAETAEESSTESEDPAKGAVNTDLSGDLVIWEGTSDRAICGEAYVEALSEMYPNLNVSYEAKPESEYSTALKTAFQSGNGPDVYWTLGTKSSILEDMTELGYAEDLTDIIDMSLFEDGGDPTTISSICYVDGTLRAVPTSNIDTRTVYYNIDLFEEYGYTVPTTVEEFEALCDQMLEDGVVPLAQSGTDWASIMHTWDFLMCTQDGGPDFFERLAEDDADFNEDVNVNTLEMMMDWKDKGYFSVSSVSNDPNAACMEFASGGTAMIICGSWLLNTIRSANEDLNFGVFKLENDADGKVYACITANGGYSLNPNTENREAALMFLKWMSTADGQQVYINSNGSIPSLEETPSNDELATEIGQADELIASNEEKVFLTGTRCEEVFESNIMKVFDGSMTPQDFCDAVAAEQGK